MSEQVRPGWKVELQGPRGERLEIALQDADDLGVVRRWLERIERPVPPPRPPPVNPRALHRSRPCEVCGSTVPRIHVEACENSGKLQELVLA